MATEEMTTQRAKDFILELLADGEWHGHRQLVGDLVRTPISEYAIRSVLREIRADPKIEAENRRTSYRHSPSWWYRLRQS